MNICNEGRTVWLEEGSVVEEGWCGWRREEGSVVKDHLSEN